MWEWCFLALIQIMLPKNVSSTHFHLWSYHIPYLHLLLYLPSEEDPFVPIKSIWNLLIVLFSFSFLLLLLLFRSQFLFLIFAHLCMYPITINHHPIQFSFQEASEWHCLISVQTSAAPLPSPSLPFHWDLPALFFTLNDRCHLWAPRGPNWWGAMQQTSTPWSSLYWWPSVRKQSGSYIALWLALNGLQDEGCGAVSVCASPGAIQNSWRLSRKRLSGKRAITSSPVNECSLSDSSEIWLRQYDEYCGGQPHIMLL